MKICILSEYAFSILSNIQKHETAGAELQMSILAKELVKRSYDVSFITFNNTNFKFKEFNGIKVFNPFFNHYKGYTYLYPHNLFKLFKTLKKINADIYIQRAATPLTGLVSLYAKISKKAFLYSSASEDDVSYFLDINNIKDLNKLIYRFGVKHSSLVLCQTSNQKELLKKSIGKNGTVLKNLYPISKTSNNHDSNPKPKILWIGRIKDIKRPELFLELAKRIPEYEFLMIGGPTLDLDYYNKIKNEASKIKNLKFLGTIQHDQINSYYQKSSILINTSIKEGFPNTYLEAWGNYLPVVTLDFDPDEIICNHKLGLHSKTFEQMMEDIKTLLKDDKLRKEMGINSRRYVEKEHNVKKIVNGYEYLIKSLVEGRS
ncbi:glycosyltransferase [Thermoplasmatales archaeon SCGC AB-539-N05]|nr:glycosyltransferase [Thermoplasmatales archaeon SCGC AB-539-N05]